MKIVWDEPKRLTNLAKHGLDFADLGADFFSEAALAPSGPKPFCCNWRMCRGAEAVSVISMRPASRKERKR